MNQKDLTHIKTIVEEGGVSQAAKKLYMSQPSLSQSVRRIEDDLGAPLFKRTPRGLVPTAQGDAYYLMACQILKIYDNFQAELHAQNTLQAGRVLLGTTFHRGLFLLPRFLADFHQKYPKITVSITEETTGQLEELILQGTLDFALMRSPGESGKIPALSYRGMVQDSFLLLLPPNHPAAARAKEIQGLPFPVLDPRWLRDENFLLPDHSMRLRDTVLEILKKAGILSPRSTYSSVYLETLARLTAAGEGVSILPQKILPYQNGTPLHQENCFLIPKEYGLFWEVCCVTLKDAPLSKAAQVFLQEFLEYVEHLSSPFQEKRE